MEATINGVRFSDLLDMEQKLDIMYQRLKNILKETKQEIGQGTSVFKEELAGLVAKTGDYFKRDIVLPVNNFIKDITQIEAEFERERKSNSGYCIYIDGKMIPAEEVLQMPMEENY